MRIAHTAPLGAGRNILSPYGGNAKGGNILQYMLREPFGLALWASFGQRVVAALAASSIYYRKAAQRGPKGRSLCPFGANVTDCRRGTLLSERHHIITPEGAVVGALVSYPPPGGC